LCHPADVILSGVVQAQPLVSIGIPLYRSRRFLDTIVQNIEALRYDHLEVIISDRHLLDDTLAVLEQRYGSDPRFRFIAASDGLNWVEHFNLLLRESRGKYAVTMPHDDSYPSHYVSELVNALERHPDAVVAFGRVEQVSLDGFLPTLPFSPPPVSPSAAWSFRSSLKVLTLWQLWFAFRGMVRREIVEGSDLYIRQTRRNIRADIYWVFALSLKGRLLFVPACSCTKRFYRSSTGADWRFDLRQSLDACRVLRSYLRDFTQSRRDAILGQAVLFPWCMVQALLPARGARRLLGSYQTARQAVARFAGRTAAPS
jgi:glycosyltransferase involved in cell wall biosynthesis